MVPADTPTRPVAPTLLLYLLGFQAAALVTAVAGGSKIVGIGPLAISATVFPYAASYWINDAVGELYGQEMADHFVAVGFVSVLMATGLLSMTVAMPPANGYAGQGAYQTVFGMTPRIVAAGLVAYLVSQFVNVRIFHWIRTRTGDRHLWLRNNASTMASQFLDTAIFISAAFYGTVPNIWAVIAGQYLVKLVVAAADTPLLYLTLALCRRATRRAERSRTDS